MEQTWRKNYLRYKSFFLNTVTQYRERSDWRAYLEILLSLGTISVFSIFALRPTVLTIAELIKEIDEKKQTLETMDVKIQNLSRAQVLYDSERGNITLLEQFVVPASVNADIFARQIEGLASKHQVLTKLVSLSESVIVGNHPTKSANQNDLNVTSESEVLGAQSTDFSVSLAVNLEQYDLLANYLADFANLRQPPQIDRVSFTTSKLRQQQQPADITLTITGKLLYFP